MLRIEKDGEVFDLPDNFSFEIEELNPIFNDRGSQTVPVTLPPTPKNFRLTGFNYRLDSNMSVDECDNSCRVVSGIISRKGVINLTSASRSKGVSLNIGFDNATAYARWKGAKLAELKSLPVWDWFAETNSSLPDDQLAEQRPIYYTILEYIDEIYHSADAKSDPLAIFPIAVNREIAEGNTEDSDYWECLNIPVEGGFLTSRRSVQRIVDSEKVMITVPERYGITPFVRVWFVLDLIFKDLGLELKSNPFKQDDLARLVVLNNAADALCTGKIDFRELMPDCTVEEFLNSLWARFGLVYMIDNESQTVDLRLIKDIIATDAGDDISEKITDYPEIDFINGQYVKLSAKTSFEGAAPSTERFEDFIKGYDIHNVFVTHSPALNMGYNLAFIPQKCKWVKIDSDNASMKEMSSSFFNWDPAPETLEPFELTSDDECVPVEEVKLDWVPYSAVMPFYQTGARHYHSFLTVNNAKETESENIATPLAFMWAFTGVDSYAGTIGRLTHETGEGQQLKINGQPFHSTTLLFQFKNGLFERYWKRFDEILRHSRRECNVSLRLPLTSLSRTDLLSPVMLGGIMCLYDNLKYSISGNMPNGIDVEAKLKIITPQGNYDIAAEQGLPDFDLGKIVFSWKVISNGLSTTFKQPQWCHKAVEEYQTKSGFKLKPSEPEYFESLKAIPLSVRAFGMTWEDDPRYKRPAENVSARVTTYYKCKATYSIVWEAWYPKINRRQPVTSKALTEIEIEVSYPVSLEYVG